MNLYRMLEESIEKHGGRTALVHKDGDTKYSELTPLINRMANFFIERGLRPGDRCALVMRNSQEFVICYFALVKIGVAVVPANYLLKAEELKYIFDHSQARCVIASSHFLRTVLKACENIRAADTIVVTGDEGEFNRIKLEKTNRKELIFIGHIFADPRFDRDIKSFESESDSLAMILYTSGTTGRPKGVMLSHKNLVSNVNSCRAAVELTEDDRFICLLPMFHTFAWTVCVLLPLSLGAAVVIVESVRPFGQVIKAIFMHRVSVFVAVPQIYAAITKIPFRRFFKFVLPIKLCISGAAPLSKSVLKKFEEKFGVPLIEGYGLTEASPVVSLNPVHGKKIPGSIGFPIPGVEVKLIDSDERGITEPDEVGELCVRGGNVMLGYYIQPEETKKCFLENGWLKTGDMAKIDREGYIYIVDRKNDLIIIKGFNVYSQEVENVLKEHPDVEDAAVVGLTDENLDEVVKAFVLPKSGSMPVSRDLFRLCRERLAVYKWPKEIVISADLPRNALGKILKKELKKQN